MLHFWTATRFTSGPAQTNAGNPMFVGEFGALKPFLPDFADAYTMITSVTPRLFEKGFAGYCYWIYDCHEQPYVWNAKAEGGKLFQWLAAFNQKAAVVPRR